MSNKPKEFKMPKNGLEPENIDILKVMSDRIICEIINVPPIKQSEILSPHTLKSVTDKELDYDRHPMRGIIFQVGEKIQKEHPDIVPGLEVLFESEVAGYLIKINGKEYFQTRLTNILLVYCNK